MASVSLNTEARTLKNGDTVEYWYLRWYGPDGKRKAKCIGRTDEISKRKAHRIRLHKMAELELHPGRGNPIDGPQLGVFLESYLKTRQAEVRPTTIALEQAAANYLLVYFGKSKPMGRIARTEARAFKTALAKGDLARASQQPKRKPGPVSVEKYIRHTKAIFNRALHDGLILSNPFVRLSRTLKIDRQWTYVDKGTFNKILAACPDKEWKVFLGLCRLAGLRRDAALNLHASHTTKDRLQVISHGDWSPKDKDSRWTPICPELRQLLKGRPKGKLVGSLQNSKRLDNQYTEILCAAKVKPYPGPFQSLRKSCIRDWAQRFPLHVVKEWSGHASIVTMDQYYLQVPPGEYDRAASTSIFPK